MIEIQRKKRKLENQIKKINFLSIIYFGKPLSEVMKRKISYANTQKIKIKLSKYINEIPIGHVGFNLK